MVEYSYDKDYFLLINIIFSEMGVVIVFVLVMSIGNFLVIIVVYKDLFGDFWIILNWFVVNLFVVDLVVGFIVEFIWVI